MIEATERGEKVEILGGCIKSWRNDVGDQVLSVCNHVAGKETELSLSENNVAEVIKLLQRGGWTQDAGVIDHEAE